MTRAEDRARAVFTSTSGWPTTTSICGWPASSTFGYLRAPVIVGSDGAPRPAHLHGRRGVPGDALSGYKELTMRPRRRRLRNAPEGAAHLAARKLHADRAPTATAASPARCSLPSRAPRRSRAEDEERRAGVLPRVLPDAVPLIPDSRTVVQAALGRMATVKAGPGRAGALS